MDRNSSAVHPSLDKRAEAAAWLARLHGPQRCAAVERGFQRWLSNPEHKRAFELLTDRLEAAESLRTRPLPAHWRQRPGVGASYRRPLAAAAAAVVVVVAAAVAYMHYAGVATAVGEQRTLMLEDGTRVYLNTDTRIVVHMGGAMRRVDLKRGEALFEVARETARPFVVRVDDQTVEALGTAFLVRRDIGRNAVTLLEGRVSVSQAAGLTPPSVLDPGQRLTLSPREPPRLDSPSLERVTAWRQGQVALDDLPLSEAVAEMNRYSLVKLVIERPQARSLRAAGFFRIGDSASFARAVAGAYGLKVIEHRQTIVLAGAPAGQ